MSETKKFTVVELEQQLDQSLQRTELLYRQQIDAVKFGTDEAVKHIDYLRMLEMQVRMRIINLIKDEVNNTIS